MGADEGFGTGFQHPKGALFSGQWGWGSDTGDYWEKSQNVKNRAAHDAVNAKFAAGYKAEQAQEAAARKRPKRTAKRPSPPPTKGIFDLGQSSRPAGIDKANGARI